MEPEVTTEDGNKKKFLLIALAVVLAIAGVAYWYLFMQKDTSMPAETKKSVSAEKSPDLTEKERILSELAQVIPKVTLSEAEKAQILKNLAKKMPASTLSSEEKLKILQALASSTPQ